MKLQVADWFRRQRLTPSDAIVIASVEPRALRVTFVVESLGTPTAFRCSLWDAHANKVGGASARYPMDAFWAAVKSLAPSYARWQDCDIEVVA